MGHSCVSFQHHGAGNSMPSTSHELLHSQLRGMPSQGRPPQSWMDASGGLERLRWLHDSRPAQAVMERQHPTAVRTH